MQSLLLAPEFGANDRGIILFGFEIYYYAICIVSGMVIAAALSALLMKRRNMSPDLIFTLFVFCIPSAILGARLFSCLTDPALGIRRFFEFRSGGLSVTGGVIAGVTAGVAVCAVKRVSFFRAADCVVVTIPIAQAIGRLGNYFNEEVFGHAVTDPALQWEPFAVYIHAGNSAGAPAGWYYAFCFYEMFINLIGFALLYTYAWHRKKKPNGVLMCLYFVWYGTVRAIMEPFRYEGYILNGGGVMWSELFALLMIGFGIIAIQVLMILNFKREGSFTGSRTGDPCGITRFAAADKDEQPYFSKINMFGAAYPPKPAKKDEKGGPEEKK